MLAHTLASAAEALATMQARCVGAVLCVFREGSRPSSLPRGTAKAAKQPPAKGDLSKLQAPEPLGLGIQLERTSLLDRCIEWSSAKVPG